MMSCVDLGDLLGAARELDRALLDDRAPLVERRVGHVRGLRDPGLEDLLEDLEPVLAVRGDVLALGHVELGLAARTP